MHKDEHQLDDFFGGPENGKRNDSESIESTLSKKPTLKRRLRLIPKVLTHKERYAILLFLFVACVATVSIPITTYFHFTEVYPDHGDSFTEGIVGEPRLINPLLAQDNDSDRDLVELIFSGLLKYNDDGNLVPDLAKNYEISSDGLNYTVFLRDNVMWHDGKPFSAEDIVFTIETAQNQDYASFQRANWKGVEIEKVNDTTIIFKLKDKYAQFLENLTIRIIPSHLWKTIKPINFNLSELNLKPIGTGPYKFEKLKKDPSGRIVSYKLESYDNYHLGQPYIDTVEIKFFGTEEDLIDAYNGNEIDNIGNLSPSYLERLRFTKRIKIYDIKFSRYFAVFLNQNESVVLSDKNVRIALNHATDKDAIIDEVVYGKGIPVDSPIIGGILDFSQDGKKYEYNPDVANDILASAGWDEFGEDGIRQKKDTRLTIQLVTTTWPELERVAHILKEQWRLVGVDLMIESLPSHRLRQVVNDRAYEALLFGTILNIDPDPIGFWHSSNRKAPGLNVAMYSDKTTDVILEEARQTLNPLDRAKKYEEFERLVVDDAATVFLYSPLYTYAQSRRIKGFEPKLISSPASRFADIHSWYIDTRRSFSE